jgi:ATP-dependent DNA helicase DinG
MSWSSVEANIAEGLGDAYDPRPEQAHLSDSIADSLARRQILLAEAPTGTGKSLAGLVAAIEDAVEHDSRAIVSTGTKNLQDQYANKELPFLQEHSGLDFRWTVLKGRGNYLCLAAADDVIKGGTYPGLQDFLAVDGTTGEMDSIPAELIPDSDRSNLTVTSEECPGANECPFGSVCFAERAKAKAENAHVVVVNHALLSVDAASRRNGEDGPGILPEYRTVLIDEAHGLEDYATGALGDEFTQRSITDFVTQVSSFMREIAKQDAYDTKNADRLAVTANEAADRLFSSVQSTLRGARARELALTDTLLLGFEDDLVDVINSVGMLRDEVVAARTQYQKDSVLIKRKRLMKRGTSLRDKILALIPENANSAPIRWISAQEPRRQGGQPRVVIGHAPLNVGPLLRDGLWSQVRSAILMSATLSVNGDFGYIQERLGLGRTAEFRADTPFDYDKQSAIFVPEKAVPQGDMKGSWEFQLCSTITDLVSVIDGRTLLLFTSRTSMRDTFEQVAEVLEDKGFPCLMQGNGLTNAAMVQAKREHPETVLFGLKSFWEGVDIPGDPLQLVIIDKLPFPNFGDIIFDARAQDINRREGDRWASFKKMSLPMMSLALQQGVGRLIRSKNDRGLIVIMDSRMHPSRANKNSKPYGPALFNSLAAGQRLNTIQEARAYLAEIASSRQ